MSCDALFRTIAEGVGEREQIYANMRAAVPIGGHTLAILDMVCPNRLQGSPIAERQFVERLRSPIPERGQAGPGH